MIFEQCNLINTPNNTLISICIYTHFSCFTLQAPRSGLAWKNFIDVAAGVIDFDFRGEIKVILFNHGDTDFDVKKGDKICQLILEKIEIADIKEVDSLDLTERGSNGFGSTGLNINKK